MEEQTETINNILSMIFIVLNVCFCLLIAIDFFKSSKKSTKPLKIRLLLLIIIDLLYYIFQLLFSDINEELYYQLFIVLIYSSQVYLFISIYKLIIGKIKIKKMKNLDNSLPPYQFCLISIILLFPLDKLLNLNPKIITSIQNIAIMIGVYILYKQLIFPTSSMLKKSIKKYKEKIPIIKNLNILFKLSFYLILGKIIINSILILLVDKTTQEFLAMPLNLIIYLKYFAFTFVYLLIGQFEKIAIKKNIKDDAFNNLRVKSDSN